MTSRRLRRLRTDDARDPGLENPRLLAGNFTHGRAEERPVVERNRCDGAQQWPLNHVGCVQAAAEPGLQQGHIGGGAAEGKKRRRRGNLKERDRPAGVDQIAFLQQRRQRLLADLIASNDDSFAELNEMRRGIDVHPQALRFENRPKEGDQRTLAVGAGNMDHRRQISFGMAEIGEQPDDTIERQVDDARMQGL